MGVKAFQDLSHLKTGGRPEKPAIIYVQRYLHHRNCPSDQPCHGFFC
jgi:hypothetical protein